MVENGKGATRLSVSGQVLYERVSGVSKYETASSLPGWPAYSDKELIGLNPTSEYWLEPVPRDPKTLHLSAIPAGACIAYAQTTPRYALYRLAPLERTASDLARGLSQAKAGVIADLRDSPLSHGANVELDDMSSAGELRSAILMAPSAEGKGEVFADYSLTVPSYSHPALVFAIAIADSSSATVFRITPDGKELWKESVSMPGWKSHRVDLSAYSGQGIRLRLLANGHGGWNDVRLVEGPKEEMAGVSVVAPDGANPEFSEPVASVRVPGSIAVFLDKGKPVAPGQSVLELPFDSAVESTGIALPGSTDRGDKPVSATAASSTGGPTVEKGLFASPPDHGRLIMTWLVRLPDTPTALNLQAGIADGSETSGVGFEVRLNGETAWSYRSKEPHRESASADLSRWKGKTVLLQLVTDSLGSNEGDNAFWSNVMIAAKP